MSNDKIIGGGMLVGSLTGIGVYFWLLFMSEYAELTIKASAFLAVTAVFLIVAWIGYTLATTPPPVPLEDLNFDFEEDDDDDEDSNEE